MDRANGAWSRPELGRPVLVDLPMGDGCQLTDLQGGDKPRRGGRAFDASMTYFEHGEWQDLQVAMDSANRAFPRLPRTGHFPPTEVERRADASTPPWGLARERDKLAALGAWMAPPSRVSTHVEVDSGGVPFLLHDWEGALRVRFPARLAATAERMIAAGAILPFGDWRWDLARWVFEATKANVCVTDVFDLDRALPFGLGFVGGYYNVPPGFGAGHSVAFDGDILPPEPVMELQDRGCGPGRRPRREVVGDLVDCLTLVFDGAFMELVASGGLGLKGELEGLIQRHYSAALANGTCPRDPLLTLENLLQVYDASAGRPTARTGLLLC